MRKTIVIYSLMVLALIIGDIGAGVGTYFFLTNLLNGKTNTALLKYAIAPVVLVVILWLTVRHFITLIKLIKENGNK